MDIVFDINILSYFLRLEGINCSISLNNKCSDKEITLKYKIFPGITIRLFGHIFALNNKNNCYIIINEVKRNLIEFYEPNNYDNDEEYLEIKLIT